MLETIFSEGLTSGTCLPLPGQKIQDESGTEMACVLEAMRLGPSMSETDTESGIFWSYFGLIVIYAYLVPFPICMLFN